MYTKITCLLLLITAASASPKEGGASSSRGDKLSCALEESRLKLEELRATEEQLERELIKTDPAKAKKTVEESLLVLQESLDNLKRTSGAHNIPQEVRGLLKEALRFTTPERAVEIIIQTSIELKEKTPLDKEPFFQVLKGQSTMSPPFSSLDKAELKRLYKYYEEQWGKSKKASRNKPST